jgi:hypothetical protein
MRACGCIFAAWMDIGSSVPRYARSRFGDEVSCHVALFLFKFTAAKPIYADRFSLQMPSSLLLRRVQCGRNDDDLRGTIFYGRAKAF